MRVNFKFPYFYRKYQVLCFQRENLSGPRYEGKEKLDGKSVVITGATDGIGKETARDLSKRGAKVFLASRNMEKCEEVRKELVLETGNKFIYCRKCDLASQESIKSFASRFNSGSCLFLILDWKR